MILDNNLSGAAYDSVPGFRSTAAGVVVQQWSGFEEMLVAETYRLAERFDERGRALPVNE